MPGVGAAGNLQTLKLVLGRNRLPVPGGIVIIVCVGFITCICETLHAVFRCKSRRMQWFQAQRQM